MEVKVEVRDVYRRQGMKAVGKTLLVWLLRSCGGVLQLLLHVMARHCVVMHLVALIC